MPDEALLALSFIPLNDINQHQPQFQQGQQQFVQNEQPHHAKTQQHESLSSTTCTVDPTQFPQRNISRLLRESDADILERGLMEDDRYISTQNTPHLLSSDPGQQQQQQQQSKKVAVCPTQNNTSGGRETDDHEFLDDTPFDLGPSALSAHADTTSVSTPTTTSFKKDQNNGDGSSGTASTSASRRSSFRKVVNHNEQQLDGNDHEMEKYDMDVHHNCLLRHEPQDGGEQHHHQQQKEQEFLSNSSAIKGFQRSSITSSSIGSASSQQYSDGYNNNNHTQNGCVVSGVTLPYSQNISSTNKNLLLINNETDITTSTLVPTNESQYENQEEKHQQQHLQQRIEPKKKSKMLKQSESFHRRLNEAAQFVKAIGEVPQDGMIQVIIDDDDHVNDDDDDEDDDDENKVVEKHELECIEKQSELEVINERRESLTSSFLFNNNDDGTTATTTNQDVIMKDECNNLRESLIQLDSTSSKAAIQAALEEYGDIGRQTPHRPPFQRMSSDLNTELPLPSNDDDQPAYIGIEHNPPKITIRGMSRGNYAQLHRKAWLEVSDKYHRYGKNLRLYYKHWESLGHPKNMFFDWLDSKDEDDEKPNLDECPRSILDSDRVMYIMDPEEQKKYLLKIKVTEKHCPSTGKVLSTMSQLVTYKDQVVRTGPNGWIFVLRDHELYGAEKVTRSCDNSSMKFRFHHSSFFGGKAVAAAGILITNDDGCLEKLYPHSGHYRPGEAHMQRMLFYLSQCGVDLDAFKVDTQQIMHVSREIRDERTPKGGKCEDNTKNKKAKKTDLLQLKQATCVALFLAHKAKLIRIGVFSKIHRIRSIYSSKRLVRNVLNVVDDGGFWPIRKVRYCFGANLKIIPVRDDENLVSYDLCKVMK